MASIFTKIVQGEIPSHSIFEDGQTLSFLTIAPINPGHTLVILKREIDSFLDVPAELYQAVMHHCQHIGHAIHQASGKKRICMAVQGFEVPHFHVHLIPCNGPQEFDFTLARACPAEELASMAEKIRCLL